jgi:hypothetical protein
MFVFNLHRVTRLSKFLHNWQESASGVGPVEDLTRFLYTNALKMLIFWLSEGKFLS